MIHRQTPYDSEVLTKDTGVIQGLHIDSDPAVKPRMILREIHVTENKPQPSIISVLFHISQDFIGQITRISKFSQ